MNFFFITWLVTTLFTGDVTSTDKVTESRIEFRINNAGIEVTGTIETLSVDIDFNEKNLERSAIIAKARAKDIKTGIPIRDKHLQRSDYFHAEVFPEITVTSTSFKKVARHKFLGTFLLRIKHFQKEIKIPFSSQHEGNTIIYTGNFEINRLDFGLGEESLILDNAVKVLVFVRVERNS